MSEKRGGAVTPDWEEFERNRVRFPIGSHVVGLVQLIPRPGAIGIVVRVLREGAPEGFVDRHRLPIGVEYWPRVGDEAEFEVTQHRLGQMRLRFVNLANSPPSDGNIGNWERVLRRYEVGQLIEGKTVEVLPCSREQVVAFGDERTVFEYVGESAPLIDSIHTYRVTALLQSTQRVILKQLS